MPTAQNVLNGKIIKNISKDKNYSNNSNNQDIENITKLYDYSKLGKIVWLFDREENPYIFYKYEFIKENNSEFLIEKFQTIYDDIDITKIYGEKKLYISHIHNVGDILVLQIQINSIDNINFQVFVEQMMGGKLENMDRKGRRLDSLKKVRIKEKKSFQRINKRLNDILIKEKIEFIEKNYGDKEITKEGINNKRAVLVILKEDNRIIYGTLGFRENQIILEGREVKKKYKIKELELSSIIGSYKLEGIEVSFYDLDIEKLFEIKKTIH